MQKVSSMFEDNKKWRMKILIDWVPTKHSLIYSDKSSMRISEIYLTVNLSISLVLHSWKDTKFDPWQKGVN